MAFYSRVLSSMITWEVGEETTYIKGCNRMDP